MGTQDRLQTTKNVRYGTEHKPDNADHRREDETRNDEETRGNVTEEEGGTTSMGQHSRYESAHKVHEMEREGQGAGCQEREDQMTKFVMMCKYSCGEKRLHPRRRPLLASRFAVARWTCSIVQRTRGRLLPSNPHATTSHLLLLGRDVATAVALLLAGEFLDLLV